MVVVVGPINWLKKSASSLPSAFFVVCFCQLPAFPELLTVDDFRLLLQLCWLERVDVFLATQVSCFPTEGDNEAALTPRFAAGERWETLGGCEGGAAGAVQSSREGSASQPSPSPQSMRESVLTGFVEGGGTEAGFDLVSIVRGLRSMLASSLSHPAAS